MNVDFMELLDREREQGRILQEIASLHRLIDREISEALDADEKHSFYHHYSDLGSVSVAVGDIALVTGYAIPDWLMKKAEHIKELREEETNG